MKKFRVLFLIDKAEEIIIEADTWEPHDLGEIYFDVLDKDGNPHTVAWIKNAILLQEIL